MQFYAGAPFDLEGYRRKAEEVQRRFGREERERAARALRPVSDRARVRLSRFVEEGGIAVTTGQQAGLLTGPLFTIYKALTLVRLAEKLEAALGTLVIPIFWVASEDHDWEEVNHTHLALPRDGVRRIQLPDDPAHPFPMGDVRLGSGIRTVLDEVSDLLSEGPCNGGLLKLIREAYRPEATVSESFTELLAELLAPFDLCITDAADPAVKEGSAGVLATAFRASVEHERILRERTERLEAAGYHAQVAVLERGSNVFYHGEQGRSRIYHDGTNFQTAAGEALGPEADLLAQVQRDPARFSPNVLLRPVVESSVFPTVAYVAGPGETSYFAQITALFPAFGIEPPMVYPRASLLLLETPMRRLLEKLELEPGQLARPRHELVALLARDSFPESMQQTLERLGQEVTEGYRELIDEAISIDPTLEGALARLRNEALSRISDSERKITQHIKRKEGVRIGQLDRLLDNLYPEGKPQERVLNVIPFLGRHGSSLLQEIHRAIEVPLG